MNIEEMDVDVLCKNLKSSFEFLEAEREEEVMLGCVSVREKAFEIAEMLGVDKIIVSRVAGDLYRYHFEDTLDYENPITLKEYELKILQSAFFLYFTGMKKKNL